MDSPVQALDGQTRILRRVSRRFTTLSGWHEIGDGVYTLGQKARVLSFANQFDPEQYDDDRTSFVALSKYDTRDSGGYREPRREEALMKDETCVGERVSTVSEKPYHMFSLEQKWLVVVLIGVAGLFSGLSSNIYFPALDAIAKVRALKFAVGTA